MNLHHPIRSANHAVDKHGFPKGTTTRTLGVNVQWHNGPTARKGRPHYNGATYQTLIDVIIDRIKFVQGTEAACSEYEKVLELLDKANEVLDGITPPKHPLEGKKPRSYVHKTTEEAAPEDVSDALDDLPDLTEIRPIAKVHIPASEEKEEPKKKSGKKKK
jgi:hypothetical protein